MCGSLFGSAGVVVRLPRHRTLAVESMDEVAEYLASLGVNVTAFVSVVQAMRAAFGPFLPKK